MTNIRAIVAKLSEPYANICANIEEFKKREKIIVMSFYKQEKMADQRTK